MRPLVIRILPLVVWVTVSGAVIDAEAGIINRPVVPLGVVVVPVPVVPVVAVVPVVVVVFAFVVLGVPAIAFDAIFGETVAAEVIAGVGVFTALAVNALVVAAVVPVAMPVVPELPGKTAAPVVLLTTVAVPPLVITGYGAELIDELTVIWGFALYAGFTN
jgi:hypothetical protein